MINNKTSFSIFTSMINMCFELSLNLFRSSKELFSIIAYGNSTRICLTIWKKHLSLKIIIPFFFNIYQGVFFLEKHKPCKSADYSYIAFLYTEKQLKDSEFFCLDVSDNNSCVLGISTTFKLSNMWITDTSYHNNQFLSIKKRKNPAHLGPVMMYFTKDEETSIRSCVELISANTHYFAQ